MAGESSTPKPLIGLTGGIASGKSTVAGLLAELGVAVVDADALAREVVAPQTDGLAEVVAAFGPGVLATDGSLDRAKLAQLVFADTSAREALTKITHPRIAALSAQRILDAMQTAVPYVVYEAALLVETGAHRGMDALVVVAANEATQLERAVARDTATAEAVRARIAAQLPLSAKLAAADYVIQNDDGLAALRERTHAVHDEILKRFVARA
jgi:dephospho-CoA kinase